MYTCSDRISVAMGLHEIWHETQWIHETVGRRGNATTIQVILGYGNRSKSTNDCTSF